MIRKFVDKSNWIRVSKFKDKTIRVEDEEFNGYIYAIYIEEANKKFEVSYEDEEFLILDNGYMWVQLVPLDDRYTVTVMFDENKEIIQWYIDITNMNGVDSDGRIFYDDMHLDIVITKQRKVLLLGEDEINSAHKNAYKKSRDIMDKIKEEGITKIEVKTKKILDKIEF